jgi:hypothetical protein
LLIFIFILYHLVASLVIIHKVAIEKVQLSILVTVFSIFSSTYSLFYPLFPYKYFFCTRKSVKEIIRVKKKKNERKRELNKKKFVMQIGRIALKSIMNHLSILLEMLAGQPLKYMK